MIIYRIFFGFCGVCVFYTSMFMVPKRSLLSTLATPPVSFVQTRPPVLLQVFLHSGKTPFHSHSYWSGVSVCQFYTPPPPPPPFLHSLRSAHGWTAQTHDITSSFPPLRLSLKVSQCFWSSAHHPHGRYRCVQGEPPSRLGHFLRATK